MEFKREDFKSNLYETSKSKHGKPLLSVREETIAVYDFDKVKDWFCDEYRRKEKMCSCDAYYQDQRSNCRVIEFKNTHHFKLKGFLNEIEQKISDTHMLLAETFWKNRKTADMGKKLPLMVVYNDELHYGEGICGLSKGFNNVKPKKGNQERKSKEKELYLNEQEYSEAIKQVKDKYQKQFFSEVEFVDKKDFCRDYVESRYFQELV